MSPGKPKRVHGDVQMLSQLNTLACCLRTGELDNERIAATVVKTGSVHVLLAKRGIVTQRDQDRAQRLSEALTDRECSVRETVLPFLAIHSGMHLDKCIFELGVTSWYFLQDYAKSAMSIYRCHNEFASLPEEYPASKSFLARNFGKKLWSQKLEDIFDILLLNIARKCNWEEHLKFRSLKPTDTDRIEQCRQKYNDLAVVCNILRSSKILEYLMGDTKDAETDLERSVRRKLRSCVRTLKRKLDEVCRYYYDIVSLGIEAKRMFPTGVVPFKWVGWDSETKSVTPESEVLKDVDPELQLIIHIHGTTASHDFTDPWQCGPIGISHCATYWAGHWLAAYNKCFNARWVFGEWDPKPERNDWNWPRSSPEKLLRKFTFTFGGLWTKIREKGDVEVVNELAKKTIGSDMQPVPLPVFRRGIDEPTPEEKEGEKEKELKAEPTPEEKEGEKEKELVEAGTPTLQRLLDPEVSGLDRDIGVDAASSDPDEGEDIGKRASSHRFKGIEQKESVPQKRPSPTKDSEGGRKRRRANSKTQRNRGSSMGEEDKENLSPMLGPDHVS